MPQLSRLQRALAEADAAGNAQDARVLARVIREQLQSRSHSRVKGALRFAGQGLTFGFGDEIESAVGGQPVGEIRAEMAQARERMPIAAPALEMAGAAGTGVGLAGLAGRVAPRVGAAMMAPRMAPQAAVGGVEGAVYGYGTGEGGAFSGDRLYGAGAGALGGAAAGGLTGGLGAPLLHETAQWVRQHGRGPQAAANRLLRRGMAGDVGHVPGGADYQAMATRAGQNPQMTLAETAGDTLQDVARTSTASPAGGAPEIARRVLEPRSKGTPPRLIRAFNAATGSGARYKGAVDALEREAAENAAPLYRGAFRAPFAVDDELVEILRRGESSGYLRPGYQTARQLAALEGTELPTWAQVRKWTPLNKSLDLETMDWMKVGLDDAIEQARNRGKWKVARELTIYKGQLTRKLDNLVPAYAEARRAWGDPKSRQDALELGRKIFKEDADVTASVIGAMNPAERDAFRVGVTRAFSEKAKSMPRAGGRLRLSQGEEERLQAAFTDMEPESFDAFVGVLDREGLMQGFKEKIMHGSHTARIEASQEYLANVSSAADMANAAMSRDVGGVARAARQYFSPLHRGVQNDPVNRALAEALFLQGPAAQQRLRQLEQHFPRVALPWYAAPAATGAGVSVSQ